jgi:hypothetical protein
MRFRSLLGGIATICIVANAALAQDGHNSGADSLQPVDANGIVAPELIAVHAHVLPKSVAGSLTIKVVTIGQDGSFDFLSSVPGVAAFTLTTFGGAASKSLLNVPPGAYTVVQTKNAASFELQSVQCSGTVFDGAAASVSITGGASSTCTFTQAVANEATKPGREEIASYAPAFGVGVDGPNSAGRFARVGLRVASVAGQQPSLP